MTIAPIETPDELAELQASVRGYLARHLAPLVEQHERAHTFPWAAIPPLHDFGFVRGLVPEEDGGDGISFTALALLMEEAGRCWGALRTTVNVLTIVPYVLAQVLTAEQKARFLPDLLSGASRSWIAITESEAGSDAAAIRTTAKRAGDGYVLTGRKLYITNADVNDVGLVLAATDRSRGAAGISAFLVDRAESPYEAHSIPHISARASSTCEVVFDNVLIPADNLVGEEGQGLGVAMRAINVGRLNMSMGAVGVAEAALKIAVDHVKERSQFGRTLASFQLVQRLIVDAATEVQAGRLLALDAAASLDAGRPSRTECSMAKYFCSEAANRAVANAMQACGGAGLMDEMQIERMYRDVRGTTVPEGSSELQILTIGKALLGVSAVR